MELHTWRERRLIA